MMYTSNLFFYIFKDIYIFSTSVKTISFSGDKILASLVSLFFTEKPKIKKKVIEKIYS